MLSGVLAVPPVPGSGCVLRLVNSWGGSASLGPAAPGARGWPGARLTARCAAGVGSRAAGRFAWIAAALASSTGCSGGVVLSHGVAGAAGKLAVCVAGGAVDGLGSGAGE